MIDKLFSNIDNPNLEAVSGMDATFLYGETPTSPMHVGSVVIIEGSLKFDDFKKTIESRLHMVPKLRKRLISVPFSIDYPYWVDDPNFNIDLHINRVALPNPGSWKELRTMAAQIFSEPLDQNRPLWSFTFVEGLDNLSQVTPGSVAIISKLHHVAIDGMAGAGILALLFDMSPDVKDIPEPKPWTPKSLPNEIDIILKSSLSFAKAPLKLPKLIRETVTATAKAGMLTRAQHLDLPTAPFTAPPSQLNGIISAQRKWNTSILELDRVKKLKTIMGTTLNDVILAICSGALRKFLSEKSKLPKKPMVAMVPISTRAAGSEASGNQLSAMLVQLATDIEDPIDRLEKIYENTLRGKTYQGALGAKSLQNIAGAVPFGIANQAARLYSRFNVAKLHNPVFNVVITNVPGPPMPVYFRGHKMHSIMGMAPIIDGMGMIITVLSYNGRITISPTSDANSMPGGDIHTFSRYILDSANELEAAVLEYEKNKDKSKNKSKKPEKAQSDTFFEELRTYLKANPDAIRAGLGRFQFLIKGPVPAEWQLKYDEEPMYIRRGKMKDPEVTLTIQDKHLVKIAEGKLDFLSALIQGRLVVTGDKIKAQRLGKLLMKIRAKQQAAAS